MADYSDIHTEALYYVPLNKTYEVWNLKVTNNGSEKRNLTLTR
jgi:N,N'-diacetylchitobiose phosphorylase